MSKASVILLCLISSSIYAGVVQKQNPRLYSLKVQTAVEHIGSGVSETDLFIAHLRHNNYQFALNTSTDPFGEHLLFGPAGDSCFHYNLKLGAESSFGKYIQLFSEYNIVVYDVKTNFKAIDTIYDYDTDNPFYQLYTASNLPYIDVQNKKLKSVSDSIWNAHPNYLDYARQSYNYVGENFEYKDKESGFRSLKKILDLGGSDCGNLSSIFITLLRMKGIPARHLMGFRPDGSLHVWAEFQLEKYGWIPVDVTYKTVDFDGDFFGNIKFEHNGFIVHRGIGNLVEYNQIKRRISGLQTYSYEVQYSDQEKAKINIERKIFCKKLTRWNPLEIAGIASNSK